MNPTGQQQPITALTDLWRAIQRQHADVPDVAITIRSGRSPHCHLGPALTDAAGPGNNTTSITLPVSQDVLATTARDVLNVLLHESVHARAYQLGITDTSREGRYHTRQYAELAESSGLITHGTHQNPRGFGDTETPNATAALYQSELDALQTAMNAYGATRTTSTRTKGGRRESLACSCRTILAAPSNVDLGPIYCTACGEWMQPREGEWEQLDEDIAKSMQSLVRRWVRRHELD